MKLNPIIFSIMYFRRKEWTINMPKTIVRPSRDLRNNYADVVKALKQNSHVIITNNGVGESVLIDIKEYEEYEEYEEAHVVYIRTVKKTKDSLLYLLL